MALGFLAAATAGLYTKYTVLYLMAVILTVLIWELVHQRISWPQGRRVASVMLLAGLLFIPWLVRHNYAYAHKLFPHNSEHGIDWKLKLPHGALATVLTPPGFSNGEWADPFTHQWEFNDNKKTSYLAFLLASSIFGEYTFFRPSPAIAWIILYCHLILLGMAIRVVGQSVMTRTAALSIAVGIALLSSFVFKLPFAPTMDYRYLAWTWLPLAILYAGVFSVYKTKTIRISIPPRMDANLQLHLPACLMVTAIICHVLLLIPTVF
jgi:hypothetical protein